MEKEMETTGIVWGCIRGYRVYTAVCIGRTEKEMETPIMGHIGFRVQGLEGMEKNMQTPITVS